MPSETEAVLHAHLTQAEDDRDRLRKHLERIRDIFNDNWLPAIPGEQETFRLRAVPKIRAELEAWQAEESVRGA